MKNKLLVIKNGVEYWRVPVRKIKKREIPRLNKLTLGNNGSMLNQLESLRENIQWDGIKDKDAFTIQARKNNKVIGWSLIFENWPCMDSERTVYFFVAPKHRRKGIGTTMFTELRKDRPKSQTFEVYPHDAVSKGFFKAAPRKRVVWN